MRRAPIPALLAVAAAAAALAASGCGASRQDLGRYQELSAYEGDLDSLGADGFRRLSPVEQQRRRDLSRDWVDRAVRTAEREIDPMDFLPRSLAPDADRRLLPLWTGYRSPEPWQLKALVRAVGLDPTSARAWCELGRLVAVMGDRERAAAALEQAAAVLPPPADDRDRELLRRIHLERAWLCRDDGRPDLGLAWLAAAAPAGPPSQEQRLLEALLLADAGRTPAAMAAAADLPAVAIHPFGARTSRSGYQERWARAMAQLGAGDVATALRELEPVYPYEAPAPLLHRYWNDVGLMRELAGDRDAAEDAYERGIGYLPHAYYFPMGGYEGPEEVFGQPGCDLTFYAAWQHHYVAGSLYSYAMQAADLAAGGRSGAPLAGPALAALEACRRRGIRPLAVRIGRASLLAALGERDEADAELARIEAELADEGRIDPAVLTVRGKIALMAGDGELARERLAAAVAADPEAAGAWSALGVARLHQGDPEGGREALDRAVAADPELLPGWFNRGLLDLEEERWDDARHDLRRAAELAPESERVLRALARAELEGRGAARSGAAGGEAGGEAGRAALVVSLRPEHRASDRLATPGPVDPERLAELEAARRRHDTPRARLDLARAYLRAERPADAQRLLAAGWPDDLEPDARVLLLQADRALGDADRARQMIVGLDADERFRDPEALTLAALICLDVGFLEEGLVALDRAIALAPAGRAASLRSLQGMLERAAGADPPDR